MDIPQRDSSLSPQLISAYRAARYRVEGAVAPFVMQVDAFSAELDALMRAQNSRCCSYLTAWNPYGDKLPTADNEARQQRLLLDLDAAGLSSMVGVGLDPEGHWNGEASRLVLGMSREMACEFGRRHQQNAVLWAGADAIPQLLLLR